MKEQYSSVENFPGDWEEVGISFFAHIPKFIFLHKLLVHITVKSNSLLIQMNIIIEQ